MSTVITAILLVIGIACPIKAEGTGLFNFGEMLSSMRMGYGIDQHGKRSEIYYTAIQRFHSGAGVDYASINIGYEGVGKHPTVMTGMRLDNLIPLLWGGKWGTTHVSTAKLPTFEFGPFISMWPKDAKNLWHLQVKFGIGAAIGF